MTTKLRHLSKRLNLDYLGDEPALLSSGLTLVAAVASTVRGLAPVTVLIGFELVAGGTGQIA